MKSIFRSLSLLSIISFLLSGCPVIEKPEILAFNTDSRILRGNWIATIYDRIDSTITKTANLNLVATYVDYQSYSVSGSFQITGEAALTVQGLVFGGTSQSYTKNTNRNQPAPPKTRAELSLSTAVGQPVTQMLILCANEYQGINKQWTYTANLDVFNPNRIPFQFCYSGSQTAQGASVTSKL